METLVTENDLKLARRRALVYKRGTIVRVRKRCGARVFKKLRVARTFTSLRAIKMVPTTQLVGPKSLTPALTPQHVAPMWGT